MTVPQAWVFEADDAMLAALERHDFIEHLRALASRDSDLHAAEVIYGELVANVVRHAAGRIAIVVDWDSERPILRVRDYGCGFFSDFQLPHAMSESGRGLFIVRRLAHDVEIHCEPGGCEVRAMLPVKKAD